MFKNKFISLTILLLIYVFAFLLGLYVYNLLTSKVLFNIIPLFVVSSLSFIFTKTLSDNGFIIFITFLSRVK